MSLRSVPNKKTEFLNFSHFFVSPICAPNYRAVCYSQTLFIDLQHIHPLRDRKAEQRIVQIRSECKINQIDAGFIAVKV